MTVSTTTTVNAPHGDLSSAVRGLKWAGIMFKEGFGEGLTDDRQRHKITA